MNIIKSIDENDEKKIKTLISQMPDPLCNLFLLAVPSSLAPVFTPFIKNIDDKKYSFNVEDGECVTCAIRDNHGRIEATLGIFANDVEGEETITSCLFDPENGNDKDTITVAVTEFIHDQDVRDVILSRVE